MGIRREGLRLSQRNRSRQAPRRQGTGSMRQALVICDAVSKGKLENGEQQGHRMVRWLHGKVRF